MPRDPTNVDIQEKLVIPNYRKLMKINKEDSHELYRPFWFLSKVDMYGPFYKVINEIKHFTVKPLENRHVIYSAYGFSGAGKSTSLLKNDDGVSVLEQLVKSKELSNKLTVFFFDLYGEDKDKKCLGEQEKITYYDGRPQTTSSSNPIPITLQKHEIHNKYNIINNYLQKTNQSTNKNKEFT